MSTIEATDDDDNEIDDVEGNDLNESKDTRVQMATVATSTTSAAAAAVATALRSDAERAASGGGQKFEFLDHTADIYVHAWGSDLKEAFSNAALAMFEYMTELERVDVDEGCEPVEVDVEGHDLQSLFYNFLSEFLFIFMTDFIVCKEIEIIELDERAFRLKAIGRGEEFDLAKHTQGTEVKAITHHMMKILRNGVDEDDTDQHVMGERHGAVDVYVLLDI